jgi:hypothetical protein
MGMPNVITHGLLAKETLRQLPVSVVKDAIAKYPQAYLFGSNGPDFLFYYNVWPWLSQKENHRVGEFGEMMHRSKINDFTDAMVTKAMELTGKAKAIFTSFVAGYLTHWSLDTIAHPFVFYRTGKIAGKTKYWHFRFESMLDSLMVKEVYKEDLSKYPTRNFMKLSSEEKQVIASGVSETFTSVYQEEMKVSEALKCMNHAYGVLKFLFDSDTRWFPWVQKFESKKGILWKYSSHMVIGELDTEFDVLNVNHSLWRNPTDPLSEHTESFIELFDQAKERAIVAIGRFDDMLNGNVVSMANVLQDRQFNTGTNDGRKMVVFDSIYEKSGDFSR